MTSYHRSVHRSDVSIQWSACLLTVALAAVAVPASFAAPFPASFELSSLLPANGGDGSEGFVMTGRGQDDFVGDVVGVGDINGDGIDDVLIGAPDATFAGEPGAGAVYAVFGRAGFPPVFPLASLFPTAGGDGSRGFVIGGIDSVDNTGSAMSAGDINGDGMNDMIIGVGTAGFNGRYGTGRTYVVFGRSGGFPPLFPLAQLLPNHGGDGSKGFVLTGVNMSDEAGGAVSRAGDVNGDGVDDLIIGALRAPNGNSTGAVYVVFGSTTGFPPVIPLARLTPAGGGDGSRGFVLRGDERYEAAGASTGAAGDVNGDGIDDLIIGAPSIRPSSAGKAYVVFGHPGGFAPVFELASLNPDNGGDGSAGFVAAGIDTGDQAGRRVSGLGDVNDDGIDDIVITAPGRQAGRHSWAGASYVIFGRTTGFPALLQLASLHPHHGGNGSEGFVILGHHGGDQSGTSVSAAGDVNADGTDDLLIGAPYASHSEGVTVGESYLVYGHPGPFPALIDVAMLDPRAGGDGSVGVIIVGIDENDYSGYSLDGAGDVNGDDIDDLIIGASFADPGGRENAGESYVLFGRDTAADRGRLR